MCSLEVSKARKFKDNDWQMLNLRGGDICQSFCIGNFVPFAAKRWAVFIRNDEVRNY